MAQCIRRSLCSTPLATLWLLGSLLTCTQVEIYVVVDEVEASGVSASTRATISATSTMDSKAAMNTLVRVALLLKQGKIRWKLRLVYG